MAMAWRDFAWQNELQPRIQTVRNRRGPAQARVLQDKHTALGFARADQSSRLQQVRAQLCVTPIRRHARRDRTRWNEIAEDLPQWRQAVVIDALVKCFALVGDFRLGK